MSEENVPRADEAANVEKLKELLEHGQMLLERAQRTLVEAERVSSEAADSLARPIAGSAGEGGEDVAPAAAVPPGRVCAQIEFPYDPASPPSAAPTPPFSAD